MANDALPLFERIASAWPTLYVHERRALAIMAGLDPDELAARLDWREIPEGERAPLLFAFRQAAALGDVARQVIA